MTENSLKNEEISLLTWGDRDCWPFARIVIVAFVLGAAAHRYTGWTIDARHLLGLPGQVLGVLSILALISFALAELYLLLFAIPLYIIGVLNDWFYQAARKVCQAVFRIRSTTLLALGGLFGEILLFAGLAYIVRAALLPAGFP